VEIDRLDAVQNLLKYQEETRKWRDKKVSLKNIQVGDFVLKRKKNADAVGKFQFAWEGLYVVSSCVRDGAFRLKDEMGVELPHSWNVTTCVNFSLVCFSRGPSHGAISVEDSNRFTFPVFTFAHFKFNNKAGTIFLT
jgi:hypothetical protein